MDPLPEPRKNRLIPQKPKQKAVPAGPAPVLASKMELPKEKPPPPPMKGTVLEPKDQKKVKAVQPKLVQEKKVVSSPKPLYKDVQEQEEESKKKDLAGLTRPKVGVLRPTLEV